MAAKEVLATEPMNNYKKWILKVSIHCEGCKRKVKKILNQVEGVYETDIESKQQKVTVTGNVDADTLLRKLIKSRMHAELWPENPDHLKEQKPANSKKDDKVVLPEQVASQSVNVNNINNVKEVKPSLVKAEVTVQEPPKDSQAGAAAADNGGGAAAKIDGASKTKSISIEESCGGAGGDLKTSGGDEVEKESKESEGKKPEIGSGGARPPPAPEEKGGESDKNSGSLAGKVGGGNDGGSGKKKKNNGQNGNNKMREVQSGVEPVIGESSNHKDGPPKFSFPDHHGRQNHQIYDHHYPSQFYGPPGPPPPAPMYATMSYNTSYPSSSYAASYYAPAPPDSYVYSSYSGGPEVQQAPPSDFDTYSTRQPLDSFEMFSDENPNGCSIM